MGEMTSVRKIHSQDPISGIEKGEVNSHVGLGSGVGLNICVWCMEQFLHPLKGQSLDRIGIVAPTIISGSRIAFGVLVRQDGGLCLHYRTTGIVLRGDHHKALLLAPEFPEDCLLYFPI